MLQESCLSDTEACDTVKPMVSTFRGAPHRIFTAVLLHSALSQSQTAVLALAVSLPPHLCSGWSLKVGAALTEEVLLLNFRAYPVAISFPQPFHVQVMFCLHSE